MQHTQQSITETALAWDYDKRSAEVDAERLQHFKQKRPLVRPDSKPSLQDSRATTTQLELFELVGRDNYEFVEQLIRQLPSLRQREHFRKLYVREYHNVQDDGSIAFSFGQIQLRTANTFLRELLQERLGKVFAQYQFDLAWLTLSMAEKWEWTLQQSIVYQNGFAKVAIADGLSAERETNNKRNLPFYLLSEAKITLLAQQLAYLFSKLQTDFFTEQAVQGQDSSFSDCDVDTLVVTLYRHLGLLCEGIGLEFHYWKTFSAREGEPNFRPNIKSIEIALNKAVCEKFWFRVLRKAQRQMVEHLAIACGDVRKGVAPYISAEGFSDWHAQMKKNFSFLKEMIVENVDDPDEQLELLSMYQKSSANPSIRRLEMMTRLRGIEEWADEADHQALFLTLTAPSSFHAQHNKGGQNKKWSGASPRQTHAYLNKVWTQFRALLAKRKIEFYGMRVAEPHHDGTPHWHILLYVQKAHIDEVSELFRKKALEVDGDEQGAAKHRCKIERCDKEKGSATAYIAKYIAKNIDGFSDIDEMSDEMDSLSIKDNARRARAWASLWNIRQFQFLGASSIGVWRELRRLCAGQCDDAVLEELRLGADAGDYAFYLDKQGGGGAGRSAQVAKLFYENREENKYGEVGKKIVGIANAFKQAGEWVKTRLKTWVIKKGSVNTVSGQESIDKKTERSSAWTCVSNCNPSNSKGSGGDATETDEIILNTKQIPEDSLFRAIEKREKWLKMLQKSRRITLGFSQLTTLIFGGRVPILDSDLKYRGFDLIFHKGALIKTDRQREDFQ